MLIRQERRDAGICILRLAVLIGLAVFGLYELVNLPVQRRTFVFYRLETDTPIVEERMLPRLASKEPEIKRYIEEALLGPVTPETAPLFSRDTVLRSVMYRTGMVYADLSESAVLPPLEDASLREGELERSLGTLKEGIGRNFPGLRGIALFINGNPVNQYIE